MLSKLKIKNFRNFKDWYDVDFSSSSNYEFSTEAVNDGIVRHGIIYGKNGSGKSNLGLAILDIISHIQDAKQITSLRDNYTNADSDSNIAEFKY